VHRLDVLPDTRTPAQRREALEAARDGHQARALLDAALTALDRARGLVDPTSYPPDEFWEELEAAYEHVDAYMKHLIDTAELQVRCGPRCSACCVDVVPTFSVEGIRLLREIKPRADGTTRIQRAVELARRFQKMLLAAGPDAGDTSSEAYRRVQLQWRRLGQPCPMLGDDGNCVAHARRPLGCRAFFSIEDPAHCEATHPRFLTAERPPIWSHPREHEFERKLVEIGAELGLDPTPNLPWAIARLHDDPLADP
jgi:Fe-S-cluster containining protein